MKIVGRNQETLLALIRNSLWSKEMELYASDWEGVEQLAKEQGVLWMLYLGAKKFSNQIPSECLRSWRSILHSSVLFNDQTNKVQSELLRWMTEENLPAVVLKGTSCSRYYPYPEARSLGDIDILINKEDFEATDQYLKQHGYTPAKEEHSFHVGYYGKEAVIEVHFAGTSIPQSICSKRITEEMNLFIEERQNASIDDMVFPVLSDTHQALMLLLHMERHMLEDGIGLRQLCDWCTFVQGCKSSHWKERTLKLLGECGLLTYAKVLTKTCVKYLGLNCKSVPWCEEIDEHLVDAMIAEVFRGGSMGKAEQEGMSGLFVDRSLLGQSMHSRVKGLIVSLNAIAYSNWPKVKKHKLLLPLCWLYLPLRYWVRTLFGIRPKKHVSKIVNASTQRQTLYSALHLYEVE